MTTEEMQQVGEMVKKMLEARTQPAPVPMMQPQATAWPGAPMMPAGAMQTPQPQAVLLQTKIMLPSGEEASGYLMFGSEILGNLPAIQQLVAAGWVRAYQPRQPGPFGGGHGNGYGRGGYSGRHW